MLQSRFLLRLFGRKDNLHDFLQGLTLVFSPDQSEVKRKPSGRKRYSLVGVNSRREDHQTGKQLLEAADWEPGSIPVKKLPAGEIDAIGRKIFLSCLLTAVVGGEPRQQFGNGNTANRDRVTVRPIRSRRGLDAGGEGHSQSILKCPRLRNRESS
jgi:hypothetical protein